MKHYIKIFCGSIFLLVLSVNILSAENILKILEGYGRDSIATFSTQTAQYEAAKLFNLILEPNGKVTAEKAEEYLSSAKSNVIRSYLSVMLADYSFVNHADDSGLRYLKRAVEEHDPIRNDSYYRAVLARAQKDIKESVGKTLTNKTSVLDEFNPPAIKEEPTVKITPPPTPAVNKEEQTDKNVITSQPPSSPVEPNFRIQVGAFSVFDNVENKQKFFEEKGYPVVIDKRERSDGYLYLIRIGAYSTYEEAKSALAELKNKYPSEEGIVIKVEK